MRIVVVGRGGQLGRELLAVLPAGTTIGLGRHELDVTDAAAIGPTLTALRPDLVVNATAENRVDLAETDPTAATAVNVTAVGAMAAACRALEATFIHVSTDYVFDGQRRTPYGEDDVPAPQSAYGRSKLAGEALALAAPRHVVLRVAGLYAHGGSRGKGGSFIDKVLAQAEAGQPLRIVTDQVTAPTWARDVADALVPLLPRWHRGDASPGLFHMTNAGSCSWYEFARAIVRGAGIAATIEPVTTATFAAPAPRPAYSVLANSRLAAIGARPLRSWDAALAAYLASRPTT